MYPSLHRTLTAIVLDDRVLLDFQLGLADGITLLCRRGSEEFAPLAEDEPAPVIDARPNLDPHRPETRHYRAILHYGGHAGCRLSNEVVLSVP